MLESVINFYTAEDDNTTPPPMNKSVADSWKGRLVEEYQKSFQYYKTLTLRERIIDIPLIICSSISGVFGIGATISLTNQNGNAYMNVSANRNTTALSITTCILTVLTATLNALQRQLRYKDRAHQYYIRAIKLQMLYDDLIMKIASGDVSPNTLLKLKNDYYDIIQKSENEGDLDGVVEN